MRRSTGVDAAYRAAAGRLAPLSVGSGSPPSRSSRSDDRDGDTDFGAVAVAGLRAFRQGGHRHGDDSDFAPVPIATLPGRHCGNVDRQTWRVSPPRRRKPRKKIRNENKRSPAVGRGDLHKRKGADVAPGTRVAPRSARRHSRYARGRPRTERGSALARLDRQARRRRMSPAWPGSGWCAVVSR